MKRFVSLFAAVMLPFLLVAEIDGRVAQMRAKIKGLKSYSVVFSTVDDDGNLLINGKLTVVGNKKYHLKTESGEVWFDGETIWNYSSINNEVTVDKAENQTNILTNPQKLLSLDCDDDTIVESVAQADCVIGGVAMSVSKILLKSEEVNFEVLLYINKQTELPAELKISSQDGDYKFNIKVGKFEINPKVKESDFRFDSKNYPDVEIIDFR